MSARAADPRRDPARPGPTTPVTITLDGEPLTGVLGQSVAGVVLAAGRSSWRGTARGGAPRGLFCGIGVCFDCLVTVDGVRDVRACQRRAVEGSAVVSQREPLPSRVSELRGGGELDDHLVEGPVEGSVEGPVHEGRGSGA